MTKLEQAAYDEALRLCAIAQKRTARDKRTIARLRERLSAAEQQLAWWNSDRKDT